MRGDGYRAAPGVEDDAGVEGGGVADGDGSGAVVAVAGAENEGGFEAGGAGDDEAGGTVAEAAEGLAEVVDD